MDTRSIFKRMQFLILVTAPLVTLLVSPYSNYDPINLVKLVALTSICFYLAFLSVFVAKSIQMSSYKLFFFAVIFFVAWMLLVLFINDAPVNQQFWGVFGRNTGFLTYLALLVILSMTAIQREIKFFESLVVALISTNIPVVLYAVFQLAGNDPIGWSLTGPFSSLGNVNFSSAFLGMASVASVVMIVSRTFSRFVRIALVALVITNLLVIWESQSSQGLMIFAAGLVVAGFALVRQRKSRTFNILYSLGAVVILVVSILGLGNIGPLARLIYSETLLYRFDYWFAGWAMTIDNVWFGVGLDSYGDWYRQYRGEIATLRTTPDRITNTAHNIYLDISSAGGVPLLLAFLLLIFLALRAAIRVFRRDSKPNPFFIAILATWIAYLVQAAISINQIGVGVWGWIFTGALIGFEHCTKGEVGRRSEPKSRKREVSSQVPVVPALVSTFGLVVGLLLSVVPMRADSNFKNALQSGDVKLQFEKSKALGATAYHMELALNTAINANDEAMATEITSELLRRYPRNFMAWRVRQVLSTSSPEQRQEAYEMLKEMDPFNPDIRPYQ